MKHRYVRFALPALALSSSLWLDCTGGERAPTLPDNDYENGGTGGASGGGGRGGRGGSGGEAAQGGTAVMDAGTDASGSNCGSITCRGAGKCIETDGRAECVCDPGYVLSAGECVVDENCIEIRRLEPGCRQRTSAEPAIGMFFGVETCAGTSVSPAVLGNLGQAFKVKEDDFDLDEESYAAIFDRDVESFVMIALDLSASLASDANLLVPLIGELKNLITALQPGPGEAAVSVGLIVFGRTVHQVRSFTTDFSLLISDLDAIQENPSAAVADPGGTNLVGAVNTGVGSLEAALEERTLATIGSVLSVGTMVTITDGRDTSGVALEHDETLVNRISIGISADIDDVELSRIGSEGSFLAPQPADWSEAFQRVAQRVSEYPDRAYMLGYCSPAVAGTHEVEVTLANRTPRASATCSFNASSFGVGQGVCNAAYINDYCSSRSCGSFLACDLCQSDAGALVHSQDDDWDFAGASLFPNPGQ